MEVAEPWAALDLVVEVCLEVATGQHRVGQTGQVDAHDGERISEIQHTRGSFYIKSTRFSCHLGFYSSIYPPPNETFSRLVKLMPTMAKEYLKYKTRASS